MASKTINELDNIDLPLQGDDEILISRDGINVEKGTLKDLPIQTALKDVYIPENNIWSTPLRQVANNCRFPDTLNGIKQAFCESQHKAGQTITELYVEFINIRGYQEIIGRSTINLVTAIEYPIRSGNIQFFTYGNGQIYGVMGPGEVIRSDKLSLNYSIPKGSDFSLWHYHICNNTTNWYDPVDGVNTGVPVSFGSVSGKYTDGSKGKSIYSGGSQPYTNFLFQKTITEMHNLLSGGASNGVITPSQYGTSIFPAAIIANPSSDYSGNATLIIGDERSNGGLGNTLHSPVFDSTLAIGIAENAFCRDGRPFINVSNQTNGLTTCFGTGVASSGMFAKRFLFAKYVDEIVNALGTEDITTATSSDAARDLDLLLLNHPLFAGKKFHAMTLPYRITASTDYFTTLTGQTAHANNANIDYINAYRMTDPDNKYDIVYDINSVLCDSTTKKWKIGPRARTIQGSMTSGSNVVNITSGTLDVADDMIKVVVAGAGASGAAIAGRLQYVSPTQGLLLNINSSQESTGVALNATTSITSQSVYMDARYYTNDGKNENVAGVQAINAYVATL